MSTTRLPLFSFPVLAVLLVATLLAVAPDQASATHRAYTTAARRSALDETASAPFFTLETNYAGFPKIRLPSNWSLSQAYNGQTGGDGYQHTTNAPDSRVQSVWYSFPDVAQGRYKVRFQIPQPQGRAWFTHGADVPPTATSVKYTVWKRKLTDDGTPSGDWYRYKSKNLNQKKAYDNKWKWMCHCSELFDLNGATLISFDLADSSSGVVTFDAVELQHRAMTTAQYNAVRDLAADMPLSDCTSGWNDWFRLALGLVGALVAVWLAPATGGASLAVALAVAAALWAGGELLQTFIAWATSDFFKHHICKQ